MQVEFGVCLVLSSVIIELVVLEFDVMCVLGMWWIWNLMQLIVLVVVFMGGNLGLFLDVCRS